MGAKTMVGLITEKDFTIVEKVFPGIRALYAHLKIKPKTFLELEWQYLEKSKPTKRAHSKKN